MAAGRTITAADLISEIRYELRDSDSNQYSNPELLAYINKSLEITHEVLVYAKSELVRTGTGSFVTVAGTQSYDLSGESMGDLWMPHRVWVAESLPMDVCEEEDLYTGINAEEASETAHRAQPLNFCIIGEYVWFKEVPDAVYTVNLNYFPNFVPLASTSSNMPYKNLFNQKVAEGVKMLAKYRNELNVQLDAMLKEIFADRAMKVAYQRRIKPINIIPNIPTTA